MELDGTVEKNLVSAIRSAKRLRGQLVHPDTVEHWTEVLQLAEAGLLRGISPQRQTLMQLVSSLRAELASRETYKLHDDWPLRSAGDQLQGNTKTKAY